MQRYNFKSRVTVEQNLHQMTRTAVVDSVMEATSSGEWVRWSDVEKLREHLESQIPEKRFERLEKMLGLINEGKCPECLQKTRGYKAPSGSFAPEAFATLREMGIDPCSGHRFGCSLANDQGMP